MRNYTVWHSTGRSTSNGPSKCLHTRGSITEAAWLLAAQHYSAPSDGLGWRLLRCRHFPLHSVVHGLCHLLHRLFAIHVEYHDTDVVGAEAWAPNLRRLDLSHPDHGPLGVVYLDLLSRWVHESGFQGGLEWVLGAPKGAGCM